MASSGPRSSSGPAGESQRTYRSGELAKKRRPTMKDVAAHAGVSLSTVSYVLNYSGLVASDRRARVLDAIRILTSPPNESARSLKRRSASTIGLIVPDL